uniref:Uncharacterized protein n=1 Tax=Arundo donax TaxID=35708 RepID=A0A0A9GRK1_ARUDO
MRVPRSAGAASS